MENRYANIPEVIYIEIYEDDDDLYEDDEEDVVLVEVGEF